MKLIRILPVLLVCAICTWGGQPSHAAITFEFNYVTPGIGFGAAGQTGIDRRNALQNAATEWGKRFSNTATIQMDVTSVDNQRDTLASAGSAVGNITQSGFGEYTLIRDKVLSGGVNDSNGSTADGQVEVNWGINWEISDNVADVGNDEYDFYSTMYHEFTHALGFLSVIGKDGTSGVDNPINAPGVWAEFDRYVTDKDGNALIDPNTHIIDASAWNTHSDGGASPGAGLFFNGPETLIANGNNPVGLFSPTTWDNGSSGSHLDDANDDLKGLMMLAQTGTGPSARDLSAIEVAMLKDLGYTHTPVPLPSAILLLGPALAGLGIIRKRMNDYS